MLALAVKNEAELKCPSCHSEALYRYGKTKIGKQRFLCLTCGRQFVHGAQRRATTNKPFCPVCGEAMNVYMREEQLIRFRCSHYPHCRTYAKRKL